MEIFEIALLGWFLGTLWTLLEPFFWKVHKGELTWADFNYGYIVNFFTTLAIGVFISLTLFTMWTIPQEVGWLVLITAFLTAAGLDDTVLKELFKWIGLYKMLENRRISYGSDYAKPTVDNSLE